MKKTFLLLLSIFAFNVLIVNAENGTENDPFLINDKADLIAFAQGINSGNAFQYHGGNVALNAYNQYFTLTSDIVYNEMEFDENGGYEGSVAPDVWTPIGFWNQNEWEFYSFQGTLEGDGHTIFGLYCNEPSTDYVGFFGVLQGGKVKNLRVSKSYFCGKDYVGGIAGDAEGRFVDTGVFDNAQIINCIFDGTVRGDTQIGGIAGLMYWADAFNCVNIGKVFGGESCGGIGGFFRDATSSIKYCLNAGEVCGDDYCGGITGLLDQALIESCVNVGRVIQRGPGDTHYGGISGGNALAMGAVVNSYYDKQMCPLPLGVGTDSIPNDEGKLTRDLTNGNYLNDYQWIEDTGLYPIPAGMPEPFNDAVDVATAPIFLASGNYFYEKADNVNSDFSISLANDVLWTDLNGNLTIEGCDVSFSAVDECAALKVIKNNVSRTISLYLNKDALSVSEIIDNQVNVYPNPSANFIKIGCKNMKNVTLTDVAGHILISKIVNSDEIYLDLTLINKGVYLLSVETNQTKVLKIIKK